MTQRGRIAPSSIEPIVERVVAQALDTHSAQLRTEIVRQVMEEIAAEPSSHSSLPACNPADLARAVSEIQLGGSQREILRALLDTISRYASRVALFVVKGSHATGWQGRGFPTNDALKDFALDENAPAVVQAIAPAIGRGLVERALANVPVADFDARFFEQFGTPASGEARILPLILKDKVAALVYADGGTDSSGCLDPGALELLVLSASAWLEVNSLRKHAHKESPPSDSPQGIDHALPAGLSSAPAPPAYNDPFAAPAPIHAMAAAASGDAAAWPSVAAETPAMVGPQSTAAELQSAALEPALAEPLPIGYAESTFTLAPERAPVASVSPSLEDQDVHRKAQRFARLLVDEIKLYNQAKVAEGRKNKDLYDRLQEVIEKSRATYQKRYGSTVAASANYFHHEIMRSLAEDDLSIMGANFRQ